MVAQESHSPMTVEEWRALLAREPDAKYEYIDGQVSLMAGGSLAHARIASNVIRDLEDALGTRPCWVYNSDAAVRLAARRYTFPDAAVTCDERDQPTVTIKEISAPRVIVEVLSESTEAYDRGKKFGYYQACPHVQEYVLIATEQQAVEVYRRGSRTWTYQRYGPAEMVEFMNLDVALPVARLYRRTDVPYPDDPEGEV